MKKIFLRCMEDTRGATAVEYGLIAALIVIAMLAGLVVLAEKTTNMWNNVADEVTRATY